MGEPSSRRRKQTWPLALVAAGALLALQSCTQPSSESDSAGPDQNVQADSTTPTTGFKERIPTLPPTPFSYELELPEHFASSVANMDTALDKPVTDAGATLGRVLFFDVNLSADRTIRCASCHTPETSFTDPFLASQGIGGRRTRRHSMALTNVRYNQNSLYFWDQRSTSLEDQMRQAIEGPSEMGMTMDAVVSRVEERDFYRNLFNDAFGDSTVTEERVELALAQFVRSLVSANATYDVGRTQVLFPLDPFPNFSEEQNRGKQLFFSDIASGGGSCSACHVSEAQLTDPNGISNNGLSVDDSTVLGSRDLGGFEASGSPAELGAFRVPSLRNVEVTGPYMHDGRFMTLTDVIDHYNTGVQPHPNLSPILISESGAPAKLGWDRADVKAMEAFLVTLSDEGFLDDERFRDPFVFTG